MRLDSTPRGLIARSGITMLVAAATITSCADFTATSRDLALQPSLTEAAVADVVINDEVWRGLSDPNEPTAEISIPESGDVTLEPSFYLTAGSLEQEQQIRVGVVYVDLNATSIRVSGGPTGDTYELRSGTTSGPVVATGLTGDAIATRVVVGGVPQVRLALPNGTQLTSPNPFVLISASGLVRIRRFVSDLGVYRGTAEVRLNAARTFLVGINELPIENYLKGVVPRELGPIAFPEVEAQKVQAVAARTYARRRLPPNTCPAIRCTNGYHIVPTTSDQVYGPMSGEHPVSSQAVEDTRGVVAAVRAGGPLIEALYSSTSGGWTANSEDVFTATLSYLRGVPDHERGQALSHVPTLDVFRNHGNPTNLRNHANGDFEADWSIYHRWYVHWTKEEMRQVAGRVNSATFVDPGEVYAINVVSRSSSGRVLEIQFVTQRRGTLISRKDAVRSALRYVTYNTAGQMVLNSLRSTLVYVEPEIDPKTKAVVGWEAWGGGWGHGTGMSQTGAVGMAEKGHTWEEILGHYYQGVVLEKRW
jgi:SpoIID/LytB domain protein